MEVVLSVCIVAALCIVPFFTAFFKRRNQKIERDTEHERYTEIKFSNGFIILRNDEVEKWNHLSTKQKIELFNVQQKMLKKGDLRIIKLGNAKRLITREEYLSMKNND